MATRCSSGPFKNNSIICNIVSRVHVGTPYEEVLDYAKSRLKKGHWENEMTATERKQFACEVKKAHDRNRGLYRDVMGGGRRR